METNALLHEPDAPYAFQDNDAVIPLAVIEEIDHRKRRQDEIGRGGTLGQAPMSRGWISGCSGASTSG
ncbi:MAG: PIN domain-containing protein [Desulfobacteraceae bacterium]